MNLSLGIFIAIIAGSMNGLFPMPMKANKEWAWENTWFPFSVLSFILFPLLIAWQTVPHLASTYLHASIADITAAVLWGILVYTGSLLFGISIIRIGVALGFALLVGTMSAVGVLTPRFLLGHSLFSSAGDDFVFGGVVLSTVSVIFGFLSSKGKDSGKEKTASSSSAVGSLLAIIGGLLSGLLPVGMAMPWAHRLLQSAVLYGGASPSQATNAVLALVLVGGALPNCGYGAYLLRANTTYLHYQRHNHLRYWLIVLSMGVLYSFSVALWGIAISPSLLGVLGPSVGWALFVGMIVLTSTAAGLISGEWKRARQSSLALLSLNVITLIVAMILICYGNYVG
jgi:L-rhamnose-H+ transport protein